MNDSVRRVVVHLNCIEGVGPTTIERIITTLGTDIVQLYSYGVDDICARIGLSKEKAECIVAGLANQQLLDDELQTIERYKNVTIITRLDPKYPSWLLHTYAPAPVLYIHGSLVAQQKTIAIVGARNATTYGKRAIEALVPPLVHHGWHIVSGGALGIDTFAHETTLAAGGTTTAILGSGLCYWYPAYNKKLFQRIIEQQGALISCFPMRMQPLPGNFPARNRIIAGMTQACLVVQAAAKSGSLITAAYALEYGREVLAVPGMFDDMRSAGCHNLLRQGAQLVDSPEQLLSVLGEKQETIEKQQTAFTQIQDPFLQYLQQPICLDELLDSTGKSLSELQSQLISLQLEGKVTQNAAGLWHVL